MVDDPISTTIKNSILKSIDIIQENSSKPNELYASIKETARALCDTMHEYQCQQAALKEAPEFIEKHNPQTLEQFNEMFDVKVETGREHEAFYRQVVGRIDGAGEDDDATSEYDGDGSIVCTMSTDVQRDPITKGPIKRACKNAVCKHVYDYDSIHVYLKSRRKGKAQCPYVGCAVKNMRLADLVVDDD